jgi:hypothetical protein
VSQRLRAAFISQCPKTPRNAPSTASAFTRAAALPRLRLRATFTPRQSAPNHATNSFAQNKATCQNDSYKTLRRRYNFSIRTASPHPRKTNLPLASLFLATWLHGYLASLTARAKPRQSAPTLCAAAKQTQNSAPPCPEPAEGPQHPKIPSPSFASETALNRVRSLPMFACGRPAAYDLWVLSWT